MRRILAVISVFTIFGVSFSIPAAGSPKRTVVHKIGDSCKSLGEITKGSKQELECRASVGNVLKYFDNSKNLKQISNLNSPLDLSECRIADQRLRVVDSSQSIAFPLSPWDTTFTSKSKVTVAIIPVDFGDAPGKVSPAKRVNSIIKEFDAFASWYSRGKFKVKWVTKPNWIRAGAKSADFNWVHPESSFFKTDPVSLTVGQKLVDVVDNSFDITGIQEFYFLYPDDILKIKDSLNFGNTFETSKGQMKIGIYADSFALQVSGSSPAMWLMHENMHKFGFAGHSPDQPQLFSISDRDSGPSKVFSLWDRIVMDWVNSEDVFCTDVSGLNEQELTLVPVEREQVGLQGVAIKLDSHRLLILESHRKDKWSPRYFPGFSGITAMIVDTQFDTDRSGQSNDRTANYLQFTKYDHGLSPFFGGIYPIPLNYLLYPGETFDFEGVNVKFVRSNFNDTINISKN